jgi:hypothetical protein
MKRAISAILPIILILLPTVFTYAAANPALSTLTVVTTYGDVALSGIEIVVCRVGTPAFSGTEDIGITDDSGKVVFNNLSAGLYSITQQNSEESVYVIIPFLVSIPHSNTNRLENQNNIVTAYPKSEPENPGRGTVSVSVYKLWEGADDHPSSIFVQLYRSGSTCGNSVLLNAGNYWSYTWDDLDPNDTWTVDEPDVPDGYTKKITGSVSSGFVITNTKKTSIPDELHSKGSLDSTDKPHPGDTPAVSRNTSIGVPQTGDTSNMQIWVMLIVASSIGLLVALCVLNSKRLARIFSKRQ